MLRTEKKRTAINMGKLSGVYLIENTVNYRKYVGSSVDLLARRKQHYSDLRCGRHGNEYLQRSFDKHGESCFRWSILEVTDYCLEREKYWMEVLEVTCRDKGYNMALDPAAPMKGRKQSESAKAKCRETIRRRIATSRLTAEQIRQMFIEFQAGKKQGQIAVLFGISQSMVSLILRGKAWKYLDLPVIAGRCNNTSGCVGVVRIGNKWRAEIIKDGKWHLLGYFVDINDAIKSRKEAEAFWATK